MEYSLPVLIAFTVHWIIHRGFYRKPAITDVAKEFKRYLAVVSLYYVFDASWGIINMLGASTMLYIDTVLYYLAMGLSVVICCRYVIAFLDLRNFWGRLINIVGVGFFVVELLALIVNLFYPVLFGVDPGCQYFSGPGRYFVHYSQIAMFAGMSALSLHAWICQSDYKRVKYRTICLFGGVMVAALILQASFPFFPTYSLGIMVGTLVIHVFIHEDELRLQFAMIDGLLRDYHTICLVNKQNMRMQVMHADANFRAGISEVLGMGSDDFDTVRARYVERFVAETDRQRITSEVSSREVMARLVTENYFSVNYLRIDESGMLAYHQMAFSDLDSPEGSGYFILGIRNVDGVVNEERAIKQQLEDARRAAEAASEAKTSFLFNMSHDIRTPMNAIIGFRTLLEKHQDDPARRADYLAKMEDSSNVLLGIINNVLEMARIEKGSIELMETEVNIYQFAMSVGDIFRDMMRQKGITFTHSIDAVHPCFRFDPIKVREVMINLMSNAYKYTNRGGSVHVDIREKPHQEEGYAYIETIVSDTGIGMSEEFVPHIFEEFSRERVSSKNKIEGTGLGMPIVKRLVELMDGTIEVASRKGEGTTITLSMPHMVVENPVESEPPAQMIESELFVGKRILLAEDNDLNAEIAMELMGEYGFVCERASNGQEAAEMVSDAAPGYYTAVLMDIQMPVMNGYEATKAIRSIGDASKASIPIIAMTANAFEEDRRRSITCGMNGHLAKPIDVNELVKAIANVM